MAKFCGNCGAKMPENAKICGNCGMSLSKAGENACLVDLEKTEKQTGKGYQAARKYALIGVFLLVAVIAIGLIVANTGANGMTKRVMKAYLQYDVEQMVLLSSDAYYFADGDYVEEYFQSVLGFYHDMFEDEVGHNYKVSYDVIESFVMSKRNLDVLGERLSYTFPDFEIHEIDKAVQASVEVTAKRGSNRYSVVIMITLTKEDGDWKVLFID